MLQIWKEGYICCINLDNKYLQTIYTGDTAGTNQNKYFFHEFTLWDNVIYKAV